MSAVTIQWWNSLRHGGLLLDLQRLSELESSFDVSTSLIKEEKLRRKIMLFRDDPDTQRASLISFLLEDLCLVNSSDGGIWFRGPAVDSSHGITALMGERVKPSHLWFGRNGAQMPVFIDNSMRLGVGSGRRTLSQVHQWLRKKNQALAVVTNGWQWRLVFAGMDYDAFCEWDIEQWLAEGRPTQEFLGLVRLLSRCLWEPENDGEPSRLLREINSSRKGQADLSQILGERIRQAAELLIRAHTSALDSNALDPQDIYRAAVRIVMRMVVILFAESREGLLPKSDRVYIDAYSLQGLRDLLDRMSTQRLKEAYYAYPRILALFRLIYSGSSHQAMPVPAYGGELFAPGELSSSEGMTRALHVFENACYHQSIMSDHKVQELLDLLTRTKIRIRQGRGGTKVPAPVDFSSLDSEYIGILYEGLLDFELMQAEPNSPVVFLGVGNQPALPLSTLESMDDKAIRNLLEKMKDTSSKDDEAEDESDVDDGARSGVVESDEEGDEVEESEDPTDAAQEIDDSLNDMRERAEKWAQRVIQVCKLVTKPRGTMTPEKQLVYDDQVRAKARQLVVRVVLPGEWYLVRWGGTRKGAGTFYTRPQLALPTVHRTLQPLAYDSCENGEWIPRKPEQILSLKVCDPACGSGSFPLAALRYLTDALYRSLIHHGRIRDNSGQAVLELIYSDDGAELLADEKLPCRPEDDRFEERLKAVLRRYVVERCIYGVDLDPLAVELCRLSLWIETLDRELPLTFLNHKIKCGNSLVGTWFDQFLNYPAMAWSREGGDKTHSKGVHYGKEVWTKTIKERIATVKSELVDILDGDTLFNPIASDLITKEQSLAVDLMQEIHSLGITDVEKRMELYCKLLNCPSYLKLKKAFNLWCALWFWPGDKADEAPMPMAFTQGEITDEAENLVDEIASRLRFFHWELEFPDVFNPDCHGFDAVLGNPPWDTSKPNSKEFFSARDPLFRSYGKQEALRKQAEYFVHIDGCEHDWLQYNAYFKGMSNWVKFAGHPFGDRISVNSNGKESHDFNLGERGRSSFGSSQRRHDLWKKQRSKGICFSDTEHPYRWQGGGDINLYKLFLERAYGLLSEKGRLGFIVPSGVYSDNGTKPLRDLFLSRCQWEWLFGIVNSQDEGGKVFDIHPSFKFNPVIVQKGGKTTAIRTAFMRRRLSDWEEAEKYAINYPVRQVRQFSPKSYAILEIPSEKDLEILTKIYSNSVLLGDDGPAGWGIKYSTEFHMTNDSKFFPPRSVWEEWGYRPDEYSRWIKGPWRPIEELYADLNVNSLIDGETRCAQPPYDKLPIPRADVPAGIILSREVDAWIHEDDIPVITFTDARGKKLKVKRGRGRDAQEVEIQGKAIALPLYEGRMVGQFDCSEKGWVSGTGRSAIWNSVSWENKQIMPQYLMGQSVMVSQLDREGIPKVSRGLKLGFMDVSSATNTRTMIATLQYDCPSGNKVPVLTSHNPISLLGILDSIVYDYGLRLRLGGLSLNYFIVSETCLPIRNKVSSWLEVYVKQLAMDYSNIFAPTMLGGFNNPAAIKSGERIRLSSIINALSALSYSFGYEDLKWLMQDCDHEVGKIKTTSNPKGFWRIDKDKPPEHRLTILSLIAFHDLQQKIEECGGDLNKGVEAFCNQNDGEGWMLPETLRLADYGLGNDERALIHQPVRECFGPRFYDWQLAQPPEESWKECRLHARNLLGESGYKKHLDEIEEKLQQEGECEEAYSRTVTAEIQTDFSDLPLFSNDYNK